MRLLAKRPAISNIISSNEVDELSRLCSGKIMYDSFFVLSWLSYILIGFGSFFASLENLSVCTHFTESSHWTLSFASHDLITCGSLPRNRCTIYKDSGF